jgi:UDP-N-acetylglucosamine 2-epimerase (non-hydrolysing)
MKKTVISITGIRPDFIRMSEIFKKLDENFNHILIHTGQHFDNLLSGIFFEELNIRKPDFNLEIGGIGKTHYHQNAELTVKIFELINENNLNPDLIIFLGDSNSVACSVSLKKEGYKVAHIEAGMRSYDKRMLEEINRIVCDHCSDFLFVYHENYKQKALKENISQDSVYVVGNTIVEVAQKIKFDYPKKNNLILLDIHRPENFKYPERLSNIIKYTNDISEHYNLPVVMLNFGRTTNFIKEYNVDLSKIQLVDLMSYKQYIETIYNCKFIVSDSGTSQEEPPLFLTPVIVPRDYTERPESIESGCSFMIDVNSKNNTWELSKSFIENYKPNTDWLGDGKTSEYIIETLKNKL